MSYCKNCGAYIPDSQVKCLACGEYVSTASANAAKAEAASSTRVDHSYLRREMEEQRKQQQENSRKWAEAEFEQRQRAKEAEAESYVNRGNSKRQKNNYSLDKSAILAIISYFSALFVIPMICAKGDRFAMYHAKQGMTLFLAGIVLEAVASVLHLGWLVQIAKIYLIFLGVKNVINNRMEPLPVIGKIFL